MSTYRITIDPLLCSGYGSCLEEAPAIFLLDSNGFAVARLGETDNPAVIDAARACPMGAITVIDTMTGKQAA